LSVKTHKPTFTVPRALSESRRLFIFADSGFQAALIGWVTAGIGG
jgi:hypothetical protein